MGVDRDRSHLRRHRGLLPAVSVDLHHCANTITVASKRRSAAYCTRIVWGCDLLDVNKRVRGLMGVSRASFALEE